MNAHQIESGVQLFSRLRQKPILEGINPKLFPDGGPYQNQIIEITGDSKVVTNDVLIDFIVKCILPKEYCSEWKSSEAVLINNEHQINLMLVIKVMETHLKNAQLNVSRGEIIEKCLKRLTIYNCYSLEELAMCFYNLERLIYSNSNISLIVLDNISAHYWIAKKNSNLLSYYQHSVKHFEMLYKIIKGTNVLFIYGRHEKSHSNGKSLPKADYNIEICSNSNGEGYVSAVTNYEKVIPEQTTKDHRTRQYLIPILNISHLNLHFDLLVTPFVSFENFPVP